LSDAMLRRQLRDAINSVFNDYRRLQFVEQRKALVTLGPGPLTYHPIRSLKLLGTTLQNAAVVQVATVDPRLAEDALLSALYANKAVLDKLIEVLEVVPQNETAHAQGERSGLLDDLKAFRSATSQPKSIVITAHALTQLREALDQAFLRALALGSVAPETTNAVTVFLGQSPGGYTAAASAGWPRVGPGDADKQEPVFRALQKAEQAQSNGLTKPLATSTSVLSQTTPWKTFITRLELETSLRGGDLVVPAVPPNPSDAFPAYFGVDVGIALAALPSRSKTLGVVTPLQYFGVSLMPSAIDKNDVVDLHTPFRQRISLNVGVELLRPDWVDENGVDGLLGGRLLLVGAGFRATSYIRVSAGATIFAYKNPAPFVRGDTVTRAAPYASLSLDFDTFGVIAGKYNSL
jgi:hypothetical protein